MGTNFYLKGRPACEHCGRKAERGLHIGKSSGGWTFGLRIYPTSAAEGSWSEEELHRLGIERIVSLDDWKPLMERYGIVNEYGDEVSFTEMLDTITKRSHPNGLLRRHELSRHLRVTMPAGVTYDLIEGEFS